MKLFLRIAGVFELVGYVSGVFLYAYNVPLQGLSILYFVLYIVFGPTPGILCLAVAGLLDTVDFYESRIYRIEKQLGIKSVSKSSILATDKNGEHVVVALTDLVDDYGLPIKKGTKGILLSLRGRNARVIFDTNNKTVSCIDCSLIEDAN